MIMTMCAVRDSASGCFMRPFFVTSEGQAMRTFQDEVNRSAEENTMFHHPDDFELFVIGTYDDLSASFELLPRPRSLATAKQLKFGSPTVPSLAKVS
jgi:hypothetical protein